MLTSFIMLPLFILIFIFLLIRLIKKKYNIFVFLGQIVFLIYIFYLLKVTFFNIPYQKELIRDYHKDGYQLAYNFIPFKSIKEIIEMNRNNFSIILRQIGGNLILILPMGIYMSTVYNRLSKFKNFFIFIICIAASIEFIQFLLNIIVTVQFRSVDIDDIILNVIGGCIGYLLHFAIKPLYKYATTD